jgi:hypothetical protein
MIKQEQTERLPSLRPIQSLQTLLGEKYFRSWRNVSSAEAAVLLLSESFGSGLDNALAIERARIQRIRRDAGELNVSTDCRL